MKQIVKNIYKAFPNSIRPEMAVDDPNHCLSCNETQTAHANLNKRLKQIQVDDFRLCYMQIDALNSNALSYYMPKLLEFTLKGKDFNQGVLADDYYFIKGFLEQLVPNEHGNRFTFYTKQQTQVIIEVLEKIKAKYYRDDYQDTWDYDLEKMVDFTNEKEIVTLCDKALIFWKNKN